MALRQPTHANTAPCAHTNRARGCRVSQVSTLSTLERPQAPPAAILMVSLLLIGVVAGARVCARACAGGGERVAVRVCVYGASRRPFNAPLLT